MAKNGHPYDHLADRLDRILPTGRPDTPAGDSDPLVDAALRLTNAPRPQMAPDMMARVQQRMMDAHRQQMRPRRSPTHIIHLTRWAAVASLVLVIFLAGLTPATASSVPGDLLYPLKQVIERVELAFATSDSARASVYLTHAERRTEEAITLLGRGKFDDSLVSSALTDMAQSAEAAHKTAAPSNLPELEARTIAVNDQLDSILQQAETNRLTSEETLHSITTRLAAARSGGNLLLPTAIPTVVETGQVVTSTDTVTPTLTVTPTMTATLTQTFTAAPTMTVMPSATPTDTATSTPTATATDVPTETTTTTPMPTSTPTLMSLAAYANSVRGVNVRSGPGLESDIVAVIKPHTILVVIGETNDRSWYKVVLPDWREGWIAASLVAIGRPPLPTPTATATISVHAQPSPMLTPVSGASSNGGNGQSSSGDDGSSSGDFGCEHPGDYCHAPGQNKDK